MMNRTTKIIACLVLVALAFYGGIKYQQSKAPVAGTFRASGTFARGRTGVAGGAGGFTSGQVISVNQTDPISLTISMGTSGSKVVYFTSNTPIQKTVLGTIKDLTLGQNITVTGSANADGSMTASSIQIRPATTTATQ